MRIVVAVKMIVRNGVSHNKHVNHIFFGVIVALLPPATGIEFSAT